MKIFDFNNPFFKPLWRRIFITFGTGAWAIFEYSSGATFWAVLFGSLSVAAFWGLFITFNPRDTNEK